MDSSSLSHTSWNCKYHIVFAPKYRRKIIYGELKQDIANILSMLCKKKRSTYSGSRSMSGSHTYAGRDCAQNECIRFCRIYKRKKYTNDI